MYISRKQRAKINNVLKPFYITSNYLETGLQSLLKFYSNYFSRRRHPIQHFLPKFSNFRDTYRLTILFNAYNKKYGYAKKHRPVTWTFYGDILLTKYGHKKRRKELKRKRKKRRKRRQKQSIHRNKFEKPADVGNALLIESHKNDKNKDSIILLESSLSSSISVEQSQNETHQNPIEENAQQIETSTTNHNGNNQSVTIEWPKDNHSDANVDDAKDDEYGDEPVENIWNLDIQEVAALITENGNDENQLTEAADDTNQSSLSNHNHHDEDGEISFSDSGPSNLKGAAGNDINEKIRQQLALLKMGKCEKSLFASKETRSFANTRSTPSTFRRLNSNNLDESKKATNLLNAKSPTNESQCDAIKSNDNVNTIQQECNVQVQKSKSNGGIIDSLFNKFQSIGKVVPIRLKSKTISSESAVRAPTPAPKSTPAPKRFKRDGGETIDGGTGALFTTFDLNPDDSNQSTNSVAMEFLGFDIANKNVDVSALLPTPKVVTSNEQAAFVSEYLDTFMKENYLENVNLDIAFTPKRYNADEALMTTDTQPPNLSVPERPMDMQRPRTLAEKRMILQQQSDISLLIIENESTVYHELKKRGKQGASYDNTLMRSIQDANIPFTRDCWRAACWISTSNNRFLYRTILYDDKEIKLVGSRGDNVEKVVYELNVDDKKPCALKLAKRTLVDCPKRCPPIDGLRINNIDAILTDKKIKTENDNDESKQKCGILKRLRLSMFSREYLTPGPKCKKVHCKSNRKTSFDLEYGPLELVQLPTVQLEVWPQVGVPLPDHIKPILKTIPANSNVITLEWAKFAVSVVRENPKLVKHRRKYKKPEIEKPQPIIFNIAYENHEKMILIRRRHRSAIIFNKSDTKHEQIESFYGNNDDGNNNQLTFAKHVDPSDTLSMECASILTNMIDSVAIAVNDTNFIKLDPDIDYVGKIVPIASGSKDSTKIGNKGDKDKQSAKNEKPAKSKLMKELKRLNVTVIDTATELAKAKKPDEICQKPFCKLGCICESIDNAKHIQTHCQRYECMFSCTCTNTPFSEPNSFYLNSSIDLLQARANARLAKEEKEFKSTIIVSENDMFVLPSSSTATKRSSKKPKRFTNDETCVDDTETETIFKSKRRRPAEKVSTPTECRPVEVQQRSNLLKSLQHVRVELNPLPDLGVEPWCMIHCLYKCHCKGRAQKGRIFNFANKRNDMTGPGGWELISPRKRQYTFERDNNLNADEPTTKVRKSHVVLDSEDSNEPWLTAARTSLFNWKIRPRRSAHELKMFRNECMFNETQRSELLDQRINQCRKYNQAKNILHKSIENGHLVPNTHAKSDKMLNGSMKSVDRPTSVTLDYFNRVITNTMQGLTALQERNKLSLNPTPNKLSIVPWDRIVHAFNASEVFIWDIILKNNLRLLALTTNFTKPKCEQYLQVTNINYADINSLPMIGKLLRDGFKTEKTKYLAVVLLRITHFWRICGVIHSDIKYMDDELRAKPTPDKNPLLGRKINKLYQLLVRRHSSPGNEDGTPVKSIRDMENDTCIANTPSPDASSSNVPNSSSLSSTIDDNQKLNGTQNAGNKNSGGDIDDNDVVNDVSDIQTDESASYFENVAMRLSLPIPVTMKQRLLMLIVGDDFNHVWFPTWQKFLSKKRILNSFVLAKKTGKALKISQGDLNPTVFVSPNHENSIFIGPYGNTDQQDLRLFVYDKVDKRLWQSQMYYKKFDATYTKKTKVSWIYPSRPKNKQTITLKIDQVYSKDTLPSDLAHASVSMDKIDPLMGANESTNRAPINGHFAAISTLANGIKTHANDTNVRDVTVKSATPSKIYIPTKIVEVRSAKPNVWGENQVMQNSCSNTNSMPFKISSVVSGERAALMTNGLPITADEFKNEMNEISDTGSNSQPKICDVKSLADEQQSSVMQPILDEPDDNACDPMTCKPNKYGDILISTKTEPIDISDDDNEQNDFSNASDINPVLLDDVQTENVDCQVSGYIYCTTNVQLGKINVECTSASTIKLYLKEPIDIAYEGWQSQKRQPSLTNVTKHMQNYIREHFYGIYPFHQKFDWIFISSEQIDQDAITLCDFNTIDPFSVVFKDKVIPLNSNYRDDPKLHKEDIFVVDIYLLASHLFQDKADVKKMKIADIIKDSKKHDAELMEWQCKLKNTIAECQKSLDRLRMQNRTKNGNS